MECGGEDAHERIDPVLRHPLFLFIFRDCNKGAANYHTPNVKEDGLEIGVQRHLIDQELTFEPKLDGRYRAG